MAHGKDAARDLVHGRRGGGWVEEGHEAMTPDRIANLPCCDTCGGQMACGQPGRHWSCCDECPGCHRPIQANRNNCYCNGKTKKGKN